MESTPEEAAEGLAICRVLAAVLDRLVGANSPMAHAEGVQVTKFHALKAPGICIQQYLERIHKYASCSSQCFIMALIYIDRLIQRNSFLLTELNVHRVVITAVLLAAKFFDDAYYNNAYYAKVGGVLVSEMNGLEVDFLFRINFSLHVTPELFEQYRAELLSHSDGEVLALQPQTLYSEQQAVMAQLSQQLHQQVQLQTFQSQCEQLMSHQQPINVGVQAPAPALGMTTSNFPMSDAHRSQITPSPPHPSELRSVHDEVVAAAADEIMMAADSLSNELQNLYAQEAQFLQRANSLPPQVKPLVHSQGQPTPYSAPALMAMVPTHREVSSDAFGVVMENQVFPLQGMMTTELFQGLQHPQQNQNHMTLPSYASREAAVAQRLAGQMIAGVTGGI